MWFSLQTLHSHCRFHPEDVVHQWKRKQHPTQHWTSPLFVKVNALQFKELVVLKTIQVIHRAKQLPHGIQKWKEWICGTAVAKTWTCSSLGRFKQMVTSKILEGSITDIDRNLWRTKTVTFSVVLFHFLMFRSIRFTLSKRKNGYDVAMTFYKWNPPPFGACGSYSW